MEPTCAAEVGGAARRDADVTDCRRRRRARVMAMRKAINVLEEHDLNPV